MFAVGDIVRIFAPNAGHNKFHLCIEVGSDDTASKFIYLNSKQNYAGSYSVPCERVPCIDPSDTGNTVFSFTMIPRFSAAQLKSYNAKRVGALDPGLAKDLLLFVKTVKALTTSEIKLVTSALTAVAAQE